ncbi:MAG: ATP-dependent helicase HrpB [Acidobacteria bacterium]|nr:ATP-dependent helicase HrpB [Acidobacteriota bacterium]
MRPVRPSLPVDSILPQIIESLRHHPNLVIEAPPGAGKTTRVPIALLDAGLAGGGDVWVLEPRRLAARMAARHVAEERGEPLGETVGYQVRFEEVAGPRTRLRFLTEGVLTRRLLRDPMLERVGVVVVDEFHERHLQADLALALLARLQRTARPDLKLVVMSATLEAAPVSGFLSQAPVLKSEGRKFDVAIEHLPRPDERPLADQLVASLGRLIERGLDGDVLVFLPGAAEIRRAQSSCAGLAAKHDLLALPLHGDLSADEQDRAVKSAGQRKVILSTNVAESSVTIDGVVAVIDSGLARVAGHSPWSGVPTLTVSRISKASAIQRAGRAGRTRPGKCLRLFTEADFLARPDHDTPEIAREDLAEIALELHSAGIGDLNSFEWFESPPAPAIDAADELLARLGAIDSGGSVTTVGRRMLDFPLHPRQSRMLVEAQSRGAGRQACLIAALIGERDIAAVSLFSGQRRRSEGASEHGPSDLLRRLDQFAAAEAAGFSQSAVRDLGLDPAAVRAVDRVSRQLQRQLQRLEGRDRDAGSTLKKKHSGNEDEALLVSILAGYPDRVARRRNVNSTNLDLLLSNGTGATLSPESAVQDAQFLVAVDAEDRRTGTLVRIASRIEPEWLIDLFADRLVETTEAVWNSVAQRVEVWQRLSYDQLVIDEQRAKTVQGETAASVLAQAALTAGLDRFVDRNKLDKFLARISFLAETFPEAGILPIDEDFVHKALVDLCRGLSSFTELRAAASSGLIDALRLCLTPEQMRLLNRMAPEQISIAGRRNLRINYEPGKPPWIESRLQDFFGMTTGPRIADGRVPLVLHLLAPNQRPLQITTDLAGFWQRVYPQVRRELSRRYPRHQWPENPSGAPSGAPTSGRHD